MANVTFFKNLKFLPKTGFLSHNFVSRCASKTIKGSKDSFSSHKSKKILSEKNFALRWRPGPGKGAKNAQTCSHCDVTHEEPKIQAEKIFFLISSRRLAESVEGLMNSLAPLVGKL